MPKARGANARAAATNAARSATPDPGENAASPGTIAAGSAVTSPVMTPEAALRRHIDWLEYALSAARAEESWRLRRFEKASKANRGKRTDRLAEVREEIDELSALLTAIRDLQARGQPADAVAKRARGTSSSATSSASATTAPPPTDGGDRAPSTPRPAAG